MGKTNFAMQILYQVCAETKKPVLYFTSQMRADEFTRNMLINVSGVDSKVFRKKSLNKEDEKKICNAVKEISELPIYIEDIFSPSVGDILYHSRQESTYGDFSFIVIDNLQMIRGEESYNPKEVINKIMTDLKTLARELNCPILILSQLGRSVENRSNHRPILSDLRQFGNIEQLADVIMFLYRDEIYNPKTPEPGIIEVIVTKNRDGETGTIKFKWIPEYYRFEEFGSIFI
jgi:replicative DNA helicase